MTPREQVQEHQIKGLLISIDLLHDEFTRVGDALGLAGTFGIAYGTSAMIEKIKKLKEDLNLLEDGYVLRGQALVAERNKETLK